MRFHVPISLFAALFLSSCAHQGVIVGKETRPFPLYASVGVDGMHTFLLRDNSGAVHRQMVTPEVFALYAVGDQFNDLQPLPIRSEASDGKTVLQEIDQPTSAPMARQMHQPTFSVKRTPTWRSNQPQALAYNNPQPPRTSAPKSTVSSSPAKKKTQASSQSAAKKSASPATKTKKSTASKSNGSAKKSKSTAARSTKAKKPAESSKAAKPWKLTEPVAETLPSPGEAPTTENPAAPAAPTEPASAAIEPAAPAAPAIPAPTPLPPQADIVSIPDSP